LVTKKNPDSDESLEINTQNAPISHPSVTCSVGNAFSLLLLPTSVMGNKNLSRVLLSILSVSAHHSSWPPKPRRCPTCPHREERLLRKSGNQKKNRLKIGTRFLADTFLSTFSGLYVSRNNVRFSSDNVFFILFLSAPGEKKRKRSPTVGLNAADEDITDDSYKIILLRKTFIPR